MQKVLVLEIDAIVQPMALFNHTNEFETIDLADADTKPTENHQDNYTTPSLGTQTSSTHSPLTDTPAALAEPLPRPYVEAGDAAVLACTGDIRGVSLLGADNMLFGVYQDWLNRNPGNHLNGGITEDGKWHDRWEKRCTIRKIQENVFRHPLSEY